MRLLDELADAFHAVRGHCLPRRIVASLDLERQFTLAFTSIEWQLLGRHLGCPLPPLEQAGRSWVFPSHLRTVRELARFVAWFHPGWQPANDCSERDWQEAQVFAGVRSCLCEVANLNPEEIVRSARLAEDLGLY